MNKFLFRTCIFISFYMMSSVLYSHSTVRVKIAKGDQEVEQNTTLGLISPKMLRANDNALIHNSTKHHFDGHIIFTHSDFRLGRKNGTTPQITGIRFSNLNLPFNTHITIFNIHLTRDEANIHPIAMHRDAYDGNTATFSVSPFNQSNFLLTTSVSYIAAAWTVVCEGNET